jgi:predicted HicB family RNase H-like nuclease
MSPSFILAKPFQSVKCTQYSPMADKSVELSVSIPPETKIAIERAARAAGLSVSEFVEKALREFLADAGYIEQEIKH